MMVPLWEGVSRTAFTYQSGSFAEKGQSLFGFFFRAYARNEPAPLLQRSLM
jgi:hypothetical protein